MKKIDTTRFGCIDIDENKIIKFTEGIPAFETEHEFIIIPYGEETAFLFLQSVITPDLAFLMVNPFAFFADYEITINDDVMEALKIEKQEDLLIFSFLTVHDGDVKKTTANLLAPVIINQNNLQGVQLILENTDYTTHHKLVADKNTGDNK
ncbi:flagellar assembly protein FliW [Pectinatus cerevisiiphilus]|uniref:Flagellar assembly factor FliW n=1 Tax=Pectinatus cerevisiiphilus TaxID=86956 RepID=A0A4R3K9R1_9FIRM|nr:flagellar assembly protein FliW [Pectinatus cerevisiiphilus]TCS79639.1 flagellar assembly factor FliW [Pectinatus cerevisiiphilus]